MWFIAANKTTQAILESGGRNSDFNDSTFVNSFLNALSTNYSTPVENISLYSITDSSEDALRLANGDQYTITWSGAAPTGVITGISFALEDAKKWLQFNIDKPSILCDGVEKIIVGAQILTTDKGNIDTTFNGDIDIPILSPKGSVKMRFSFYLGVASKMVTTTDAGVWSIPANSKRAVGYRVDNTITFDSVM
jgi:hypothetical protein